MRTRKAVPIDELIPHPENVRQGDIGAIALSLETHGQYRPIVVQESTNHIVAGNHTWKAAQHLGWKTIAVTFIDVDDDRARRIMLVDNRTNDIATYDDAGLAALLVALTETPDGLAGTGYDGDDLDTLLYDLDTSEFLPVDDTPRLDETQQVECPACGETFTASEHHVPAS